MPGILGSQIAPMVAGLVDAAGARGVDRDRMLAVLGVDEQQLTDPERRIPFHSIVEAWELAMRASRDPGLPVAAGRIASVERCGLLGYAMYTSATIEQGLQTLIRYHDLVNDTGRWTFEAGGSGAVVTWSRPGDGRLGLRCANERTLSAFVTVSREIAGDGLSLSHVQFRHPRPASTDALDAHFGLTVAWGAPTDGIVLTIAPGARTRGADAVVGTYFARAADDALARVAATHSWSGAIASAISDALPSGIPTLEQLARRLGTSERTARRRLAAEGARFEELVESVQRERAEELVRAPIPLRDVAFALGFSDPTAFSRAYRRWTGRAPSQDRRDSLGRAVDPPGRTEP